MLARVLAAVLLTAASGCGCGDDDDLPDIPDGPYGDLLEEVCGVLDRCPEGLGYPIAYRSRAECAAILDFALTCRLTEQELGNDVTLYGVVQNRPELDEDQAQACIDWLHDASCEEVQRAGEGTPCSLAFSGTGDDDDDDGDSGDGILDQPCSGDYDCLPDLWCQPGGADPEAAIVTCQVCKPRLAAGGECQQYGRSCEDGLHCSYTEEGPRVCAPLDADGTRCVESEQCQSGFCNETLDPLGGWGQCDPGGNEGDPCRDEADTASLGYDCRPEFHCDQDTCQPKRRSGEPCSDGYECATAACDLDAGVCGQANGTACYDHPQCASGLCIDELCTSGAEGACVSDGQCDGDDICVGACRPPNCFCSGNGCPIGACGPAGGGGGGCQEDEDCASGDCEDGVCTQALQIGDPCSASYECYPVGSCSNGVCVERFGPGDECDAIDSCQEPFLCFGGRCELMNLVCEPASAGEHCAWLRVCDEDSWCDLFDEVTCKPRADEGEECATSYIPGIETCKAGLTCETDETGASRCRARPGVGEACTTTCVEGTFCFEGTCQEGPVGQPCDYDVPCPAGLFCDDHAEVCLPVGGEGAECDDATQCQADFFCENYSTCTARRARGEECRDSTECRQELYCDDDTYTCQTDLAEGELCDSRYAPCAAGLWCPNSGIDPECTEQTAAGEPCSSNEECASGACYSYSWCQAEAGCVIPE